MVSANWHSLNPPRKPFADTGSFFEEIISEMKIPMEMPKAYAGIPDPKMFQRSAYHQATKAGISAPFQLTMFAVAGIGGYMFMGSKAWWGVSLG